MTLQASAEDIENVRVWRRMWWPWPQLVNFLKSLRFWRYRQLYIDSLIERCGLAAAEHVQRQRAHFAMADLRRVQAVLAPYGETILTGQAEDTEGPIVLPALEYEMAKAFFAQNTRRLSGDTGLFDFDGIEMYAYRGRLVKQAA